MHVYTEMHKQFMSHIDAHTPRGSVHTQEYPLMLYLKA